MIFEKQYSDHIANLVRKYQKKYGFDMQNGNAHNNEADAFRHTFMQAELTCKYGAISAKWAGDNHEKKSSNPKETNMDLWNNQIGRQIGREVKQEMKEKKLKGNDIMYDMIAQKIVDSMRAGKLITNPNDSRKFIQRYRLEKDGTLTGLAADITDEEKQEIINKYRNEGVFDDMSDDEILELNRRAKEYHLFNPKNRVFYENEFRPIDAQKGSNDDLGRIFGRATALA